MRGPMMTLWVSRLVRLTKSPLRLRSMNLERNFKRLHVAFVYTYEFKIAFINFTDIYLYDISHQFII